MAIKIKEEFAKTIIGFNGGGRTPLGERSQEDIDRLAYLASASGNKNLLKLFDGELPTLGELKKMEADRAKAKKDAAKIPTAAAEAKPASSTPSSVSNVGATGGSAANAAGSTT